MKLTVKTSCQDNVSDTVIFSVLGTEIVYVTQGTTKMIMRARAKVTVGMRMEMKMAMEMACSKVELRVLSCPEWQGWRDGGMVVLDGDLGGCLRSTSTSGSQLIR